jgi:NADH-ubiquinone oxidoreductase chain 4
MTTVALILIPLIGVFITSMDIINNDKLVKYIGLLVSIINLILSLIIFITFDFSLNEFQFVQNYLDLKGYNIYLGLDGLSIYFVLLTTIIMPISILSN